MISKIAAGILITVFILFFLSVIAPMHSEKKFWVLIRRIRKFMDIGSFWFYILSAAVTVLFIAYFVVKGLLN